MLKLCLPSQQTNRWAFSSKIIHFRLRQNFPQLGRHCFRYMNLILPLCRQKVINLVRWKSFFQNIKTFPRDHVHAPFSMFCARKYAIFNTLSSSCKNGKWISNRLINISPGTVKNSPCGCKTSFLDYLSTYVFACIWKNWSKELMNK